MLVDGYRPYTAGSTARNRLLGALPQHNPGVGPPAPAQPGPRHFFPMPTQPAAGQPSPPSTTDSTPGTTSSPQETGFQNDPIYQQIVGLANQDVADAEASATGARKQAVLQLGDPALALKLGLGQQQADTAQANPFSTLKNLLRGHLANVTRIDQEMSRSNLWSSSTRTRQQQQESQGYLGNLSGAAGQTQSLLADILSKLLTARSNAAARKAAAAADAYTRWRDSGAGAGGDGGTEPPGTSDWQPIGVATGPDGGYTQQDLYRDVLNRAIQRQGRGTPSARGPAGGV